MNRQSDAPKPLMCSIFTAAFGEKVLYGNNEDNERSPDETFIAFVPRQEVPNSWSSPGAKGSSYINGFMLVGVIEGNTLAPQGGINEKGFCYDINGLPPVHFNGKSGIAWREWFNCFDILWHCSTVKDAQNWFLTHEFRSGSWDGGQFHFADATGDAMVMSIGPDGDYAFTWKGENQFLVSTNFNLVDPSNCHGYPCRRFDTMTKMLSEIDEDALSVQFCEKALDSVHIEYKNRVGTVYSNIFDLVDKKAYIYHLHDFSRAMEFDLNEELSRLETNTGVGKFKMFGSTLFSEFQGVRIHVIEDLFSN